jgi:starch phosphorylase
MKFMMNGALTCGTLDGANIEIVEQVGKENAFIFGLTAAEVAKLKGYYSPWWHYENEPAAREVADMIFRRKVFCPEHPDIFEPVRRFLFDEGDPYMHFADFMSYCAIHEEIDRVYAEPEEWSRRAVLNIAASGKFSSDRSIRDYAEEIWHARRIEVLGNVDDGVVR